MNSIASALTGSYIALVGSPNSGKTSLFNSLTGSRQKVGNYPGVTIERKEGYLKTSSGATLTVLDLPGTYSLQANTSDEKITREVLLEGHFESGRPSLLIAVADATNLERSLNFVLELKNLGLPMVLALNMMDLAKKRGLELNERVLSDELGVPVIPLIATRKKTTKALVQEIERQIQNNIPRSKEEPLPEGSPKERLIARYREIDRILKEARIRAPKPDIWTQRIDKVVLHPLWGTLLLYTLLAMIFQAIFNWANIPMDLIETGIMGIGNWIGGALPESWLRSLVVDGVIAGVGAVVVFLPQILFLFFVILLLEDSGYMARAAFLMDRHMRRVGLHGRAFIPLLSSFACAIPGIMATRTIENKRDRVSTILISPLMACSARIPVYTLLIAAFIPNNHVWGPFYLQGLVMLGLYLGGALIGLAMAYLFKRIIFKGRPPLFILELPTYKWPNLRNVFIGMMERAGLFLKRAGTIILAAMIVVWFISSYPKAPKPIPPGTNAIEYSYAGRLGKLIEPAIRPLGFDWRIGVGLVTGVVAREVIVGSLATLYSVEDQEQGATLDQLSLKIKSRWSMATGLSLLVFFVFAMQCLSTLAVVRRETNSWRYPAFMFLYLTALAYGAAFLTYRVALYLQA